MLLYLSSNIGILVQNLSITVGLQELTSHTALIWSPTCFAALCWMDPVGSFMQPGLSEGK